MDYISRNDALKACHAVMPTDGIGTVGLTYQDIKELPSADVEKVTRCESCRNYKMNPSGEIGLCSLSDLMLEPTFYCASGERYA